MNTLQKTKLRGTGINCGLIVLLFAVVLLLGQVLPQNTYRRVLVPIIWQMCIFILLGTSLNLTLGYLGQLTLGHMGFAGVGAYTAALTSLALERAGLFEASKAAPGQLILVILGCCLLGAIFAGLLGLLVGIPALRLHGDYLAIVTLGFGLIVENVIANLPFAGGEGLANGTASSSLYANGLGLSTSLQAKYVWLVLGITILCIALMCMFIRSKYGRAIEAIRDDEIAAEAMGVNLAKHKSLSFVISSFFAGVSGALFAMFATTVQAKVFTSAMTYEILLIVVIGGIGSVSGSCIASFLYIACSEWWLRFLDNEAYIGAFKVPLLRNGFRMVVFSVIIMIVVLFFRKGIMGERELPDLFRKRAQKAKKNVVEEGKAVE